MTDPGYSQTPGFFERFNDWRKNSLALKLATVGILILLMQIPLGMIESLIWERSNRKSEAEAEVASTWGGRQEVCGPVLTIPYIAHAISEVKYDQNGNALKPAGPEIRYAHFLPATLNAQSQVEPMIRKRGIYEILVYNSDIQLDGSFGTPDFSGWPEVKEVLWESAFVSIGISDMRAIRDQIGLQWNGEAIPAEPGVHGSEVLASGVSARVPVSGAAGASFPFSAAIRVGGNSSLMFVPLGQETAASMSSSWPSPKFTGAFLPDPRPEVSREGFSAAWKVLHLNRNYPQRFLGYAEGLSESAFGAELLIMVDQYQRNERSAKYGIMLITLVFLMFFFSQALNRMKIHFVQYLLVGFALSLFYLLLLSFSEHIGFNWSYALGAFATAALVTLYFKAITASWKLSAMLLFLLCFIFSFIFVIIQMEDFALLVGSTGLFVVLAVVMYLSRKVDWYTLGRKGD
jgi:inner membrane protein